jgi:predicted O-methyltransferase YrrM
MKIDHIRAVRRDLAQNGPPRTRPRDRDFATISVPGPETDQLRDLFVAIRAETVVEVGLAYAASALAIGEALAMVGAPDPRHVIIDPYQEEVWQNAGRDLLRAAGTDAIARLMPEPSSRALARLVTEGLVADAAFVDGSHRFHEVFVDLYHLREIVRPGGLVVVDDHDKPSVGTAVRYYERNLGWLPVPDAFPGSVRCRALRLPDPPIDPPYEDFRPF